MDDMDRELVSLFQSLPYNAQKDLLVRLREFKKTEEAPAPGMSENGREMLELYERLPEREQLLLLGRLQEMTAPVSGEVKGGSETDGSSAGRAG